MRFLRKFWGLSAWMLEVIAALSLALHRHAEFGIAIALLLVNAILGFLQEHRASSAVAALRSRLQVTSRALRDGAWRAVPARELVTGDVVRLRAGDFVPADALLADGELRIDQSALTGESREVPKGTGEPLHSGSIVRRGEASAVVTATGPRTWFGRTTHLIQSAHPKLHVEEITARLVRWLLLSVGALVAVTLVVSTVRGLPLVDVLPLSLVLLMSAVPVALPVMFTVTAALGSMELGRRGVLVTHLAAVEDAANMDVLCADKTGTLTLNRLSLGAVLVEPGFSEDDLVRTGALASNAANQDPIDLSFLRAAADRGLLYPGVETLAFTPFSPETRRTEAIVEAAGRRTRATKGALRTIAALVGLGPDRIAALEARADEEARKGARVLAVARSDADAPLSLVGLAFLHDPPRPDSRELIERLHSLGVRIKMLTGDGLPVAREVARELGLGEIARAAELPATERPGGSHAIDPTAEFDGFAEIFPEDKFRVVKSLQAAGHVVGMTGDGVNDAPALGQAEVGIAVSSATDVAKGAASIVLTTEGLASIVDLVRIGRSIYQRVLTWIVNKVSRTILKAGFVVFAFLFTGQFVVSALGMILLVFMTDFVKIALSTDRVRPSPTPESWRIGSLVRVALVLGVLMLSEALGLLAVGLRLFDLGEGRLHTFSFLTLLYFALASILSIRERRAFWRSRPSLALAAALAVDAAIGTLIGTVGFPAVRPLPIGQALFVAGCALLCCLGPNDLVKSVLTERAERRARAR